ncbi:MAG TPA: proton-conducting transporter membrane subunit [Acidimicrobiales bacterium]
MNEVYVVTIALAGMVAAILGGALPASSRVGAAVALTWVSCGAGIAAAVSVLSSGHAISLSTGAILPLTGVTLVLNPLGALFVISISVVALASTLYWLGYASHGLATRSASSTLPLFVTSMLLVPFAASVATFLVLWEMMALASLVLVLTDQSRREAARSAAQWYAVMTHAGAAAILLALVLLSAHSGGQTFADIEAHARHLSGAVRGTIFVLALLGFGSKAGAVPLHVWLPKAHAEAPGPASALMSGAMVNLGIYGIILVGNELLGGGPVWWWLLVSLLGVVSALYGALYAATSSDLKRLLAYSTTDNMGLVLIALGASGLFGAVGRPTTAAIAMVAALLLLINHSVFKGALFLAAGAVQVATGARDLDRLGGLMRRMPVTGVVFFVGALSVAALPPCNGFVGEWLLFQGLLHGLPTSNTSVVISVAVAVAALALTGGLTVAAFVKATGIGFLGRARSDEATEAHEAAVTMRLGAAALATLCLVLGLVPMLVLPAIERAAASAGRVNATSATSGWISLHLLGLRGVLAPSLLAAGLAIAVLVVIVFRRLTHRRSHMWPAVNPVEPWGSGRTLQTSRMQYTATSFAEPLQRVFDDVIRPARDLDVSHFVESRYYIERIAYRTSNDDVIERKFYRPFIAGVRWWGQRARWFQNGSVHRYLAYGFVALVIVLVVVA